MAAAHHCIADSAVRRDSLKFCVPDEAVELHASLGNCAAWHAGRGDSSPHVRLALHTELLVGAARQTRPRHCAPLGSFVLRARPSTHPASSAYTEHGAPLVFKVMW